MRNEYYRFDFFDIVAAIQLMRRWIVVNYRMVTKIPFVVQIRFFQVIRIELLPSFLYFYKNSISFKFKGDGIVCHS